MAALMTSSGLGLAPRIVVVESERRAMVAQRVAPAGEPFVYGVRSTRIYCRSDCPSRRPAPEQIVFFDTPREAVASGFRACRRCHPERGLSYSAHLVAVEKACRILDQSAGEPLTLTELSRRVGYSPFHFQRMFTRLLGVSPKQYLDAARTGRFRAGLRRGLSVRASTYAAGHRSLSWPYSASAPRLGMGAGAYRRGAAELTLEYSIRPSPLGPLLVAATPRGISFVGFGEPEEKLVERLGSEFPHASLRPTDSGPLTGWIDRIVASLERGQLPLSDLPLDIRATTFQARVWHAIRSIVRGATASYSEIAIRAGYPGASRAVARACHDNPAALLIPCHRVIRANGDAGGYRWGTEQKRALLAREGSTTDPDPVINGSE